MFYCLFNIDKRGEHTLKQKIILFFQGVLLHIVLVFCAVFLIISVDEGIKALGYPSVKDLFRKSKEIIDRTYSFYIVVILAPIIEELFFRLVLVPKKRNVAIFSFLLSMIICYGGKYPKEWDLQLLKSIITSLLVVVMVLYLFHKKR